MSAFAPALAPREQARRAFKAGGGQRAVVDFHGLAIEAVVVETGGQRFAFTRGAPIEAPVVLRWL